MIPLTLIVSLLLACRLSQAVQWTQGSIATMHRARGCVHENYNIMLRRLFAHMKRDSETHREVEAAVLDQIGRVVRTGRRFCKAYAELIPWTLDRMENQLARTRPGWAEDAWIAKTRAHLNNATALTRDCESLEAAIDKDDPGKLNGVLSPGIRCITGYRQHASKAFILDQFANEEV